MFAGSTRVIDKEYNLNESTSIQPTLRVPFFITSENKWLVFTLTTLVSAFLYLTTNHFPLREPQFLSLTVIDARTPILPWTVWIYLSEYLLFILAVSLCRDLNVLNRFFYSFMFLQVFAVLVFTVYPTTFPREAFPLLENADSLSAKALFVLRQADAPNNCFPSLHVASCLLFSLMFFRRENKKFWFFAAWTTLVSISTLTTKQHYLADVVAGGSAAVLSYMLFFKIMLLEQVEPEEYFQALSGK